MKSLGIDIGASSIKVAEIEAVSSNIHITQITEHFLNQDPNHDSQIDILDYLKNLIEKYDPSTTRFVLGVRQEYICLRNRTFPFHERQKILKSLPFELEEEIPFSLDNAIFDSKILRLRGQESDVLACAVPKSQVERLINLSQDCGFELSSLTGDGIGLANLIENWTEPPVSLPAVVIDSELETHLPHSAQVVIDLGHSRTLIMISDDRGLLTVRSILWGGRNIAKAIAQTYRLSYLEGLKEMQNKAFLLTITEGANKNQITFSETIATQVREMAHELKLILLEAKSHFNLNYTNVELLGGTSRIRNLGPYLTQLLEIPCNPYSYLSRIPHVTPLIDETTGVTGAVAIGLAIEGLKKPRNPAVNFLKQEFAKEGKTFHLFWQHWGATIKFATAIFVLICIYGMLRESTTIDLNDKAHEVLIEQAKVSAGLSEKRATSANIKKFIDNRHKMVMDQKSFLKVLSMNSALDILKELNDVLPTKDIIKLDLTEFRIEGDNLYVAGTVGTGEINLIHDALAKIARPNSLKEQPVTAPTGSDRTNFAFEMVVDRKVKGSEK